MSERNLRRALQGMVVSDKMDKTVTIRVDTHVKHPKYGKFVRKSKKYHAHDEKNDAHEGDWVEIIEMRKLSKNKTWRLVRIMERAK